MKKKVIILGSTGSIGSRTLDVIRDFTDIFEVVGLSSNNRIDILEKQINEFNPKCIVFGDTINYLTAEKIAKTKNIEIFKGLSGLVKMIEEFECDIVVVATVGFTGLLPTLKAIELNRTIALANKEVLVTAGHLVMSQAKQKKVNILPIDSEHNAIFQCLFGQDKSAISKIILTASGGPFRNYKPEKLKHVTIQDALKHPTWNMGAKITIDSSTLMNKGFEVIEGMHLFDVPIDLIDVVIHPQSVIHSLVEFIDGSILAQLGKTDMYLPIQNILTFPQRYKTHLKSINLTELGDLSFYKPNKEMFPCLRIAYDAGRTGGTIPAAMNAANEIAVEKFLNGEISFTDIPLIIEYTLSRHKNIQNPDLDSIIHADVSSRETARNYVR